MVRLRALQAFVAACACVLYRPSRENNQYSPKLKLLNFKNSPPMTGLTKTLLQRCSDTSCSQKSPEQPLSCVVPSAAAAAPLLPSRISSTVLRAAPPAESCGSESSLPSRDVERWAQDSTSQASGGEEPGSWPSECKQRRKARADEGCKRKKAQHDGNVAAWKEHG